MEINWREIARMAYEKYAQTVRGLPPAWGDLSEDEQTAWVATVRYAVEVYVRAVTA